ncbi:hypothetical protein L596_014788 [Steinernema carpocapsae]|nr:hypothetical protein L596_014788 [Steinernema carpocapsae]
MFDRYRNEIEDVRRSRTSLHQTATTPTQHTKSSDDDDTFPQSHTKTTVTHSVSQEVVSRTNVNSVIKKLGRQLPGYTVTTVPHDWDVANGSRVIEVADTFVGAKHSYEGNVGDRYCGRVTLEEVLDAIFQETEPSHIPNDPSAPQSEIQPNENIDGPGIYTANYMLMDKVIREPHLAESLLREEQLYVRCSHCHRTKELSAAREHYLSCKHCYKYYCCHKCRLWDWDRHKDLCSFARINTLCKDIIVRGDPEAHVDRSQARIRKFRAWIGKHPTTVSEKKCSKLRNTTQKFVCSKSKRFKSYKKCDAIFCNMWFSRSDLIRTSWIAYLIPRRAFFRTPVVYARRILINLWPEQI